MFEKLKAFVVENEYNFIKKAAIIGGFAIAGVLIGGIISNAIETNLEMLNDVEKEANVWYDNVQAELAKPPETE
jgi:hypothetical protein